MAELILLVFLSFLSQVQVSDRPFTFEVPEFSEEEVPKKKKLRIKFHPNTVMHQMNASCLRKKNFSEEGANQVVDAFLSKGKLLYYYKCNYCLSFHMTSSPPKKPKTRFEII